MRVKDLLKEATTELESEKKDMAKEVLKARITEINKTEKVLKKLKDGYTSLLDKSVDEVADEIENRNVRF